LSEILVKLMLMRKSCSVRFLASPISLENDASAPQPVQYFRSSFFMIDQEQLKGNRLSDYLNVI